MSARPVKFDIVETPIDPGLSVIEASAGTGKTYAISRLVPRLLLERTVARLGEILLVTFTNDAARELSDRVRGVLEKLHAEPEPGEGKSDPGVHALRQKFDKPEDRGIIARALLDIDQLGVSTIHSFCQRVLQTEGTLCGLPVMPELIPDADPLIEEALYDIWSSRIAGDEMLSAIASAQKWNPASDLKLVKQVLGLDDFEPVPPARPLALVLQELKDGAAQFTEEMVRELVGLSENVAGWNSAAGTGDFRLQQFSNLRNAGDFSAWIEAVQWLPRIGEDKGGLITAKGNANKALIKQAAGLPAVHLARKISGLYGQLSWHWQMSCASDVRCSVLSALQKNRQITYDGLIATLLEALRSPVGGPQLTARLRDQYKVALIDESQDTDPRQFEVFRTIFHDSGKEASRMVLIGDPKQAIYEFRGADVNTYLAARKMAGAKVFSLSQTFRSPQPLVQAVNTLFKRDCSLLKNGLEFSPASSGLDGDIFLEGEGIDPAVRLEAWIVPDDQAEAYGNSAKRLPLIADTVASEIVRLLQAGVRIAHSDVTPARAVQPGDFAILVSNRFEAAAMIDALQARRVPAIQAKSSDILISDEAGELLVILRAIEEPRRSTLRLAALSTRLMGRNADDIRRIREDAAEDDALLEKFLRWQTTLYRQGIAAALAEIDHDENVTLRLAGTLQGDRRITNLRQLSDLLQAASHELGNRPGHLVRWFGQEMAASDSGSDAEERQQQLESDAQAVKIVTMHAAKGLEYNLVFCPFLWSSRSIKGDRGVKLLSRPGLPPQLVNPGLITDRSRFDTSFARAALEDRLRLAYVAITRAKVKAWIFGGALSGNKASPSALDWLVRVDASPDFEAWFDATGSAIRGSLHTAGFELHVAEGRGVIEQKPPPPPEPGIWNPPDAPSSPVLSALDAPGIPEPWGMTSFSSLTREKNPHSGLDAGPAESAPVHANAFSAAPGGAGVGTAVHDWIERWDFSNIENGGLLEHLRKYDLPPVTGEGSLPMHESVRDMLNELRAAVLPGLGCTVSVACPRPESSEWHFQLPIDDSLSAHSLAAVFAAHGEKDYAAALEALPAEELKGYLHGFLDRLTISDGVWGVIDWKTNKLDQGYGLESLQSCARQSHYLLQTHLYLVALRRFLGPDAKIAGAWLVFLRGIRSGSADGILHIQPSDALMRDLDRLFARPAGGSRL